MRLFDRLFKVADPDDDSDGKSYHDHLNADSRRIVKGWLEAGLAGAAAESSWQFERLGYFVADRKDHAAGAPVFNRITGLKDSWGK